MLSSLILQGMFYMHSNNSGILLVMCRPTICVMVTQHFCSSCIRHLPQQNNRCRDVLYPSTHSNDIVWTVFRSPPRWKQMLTSRLIAYPLNKLLHLYKISSLATQIAYVFAETFLLRWLAHRRENLVRQAKAN